MNRYLSVGFVKLSAWLVLATLLFSTPLRAAPDAVTQSSAELKARFDQDVHAFFTKHCVSCHGPDEQQSLIRVDQLAEFRIADRGLWSVIHEQVSQGAMPPEDEAQPTPQEKRAFLHWIEVQDREFSLGKTRRLNRRELSAALQDITGLTVDYAAALPGDGKINGFDTGADALQDSADSVAQTLQITRRAVDALCFLEKPTTSSVQADYVNVKDTRNAFDAWKTAGVTVKPDDLIAKPGTGFLIRPKWLGDKGGLSFRVLPPPGKLGVLRVKLTVAALKSAPEIPWPRLWVDVGGKDLSYAEISNSPSEPRTLIFDVSLGDVAIDSKGVSVTLSCRVEHPYEVQGFANDSKSKPGEEIPGGTGLYRPVFDKKLPPEKQPVPFVVLQQIEIDPDYQAVWPPAEWQSKLGPVLDDPASANKLLQLWIERAWRRPVNDAEQQRFRELYAKFRKQGLGFDESLRATFQSVLMSGSFRYLSSPHDGDAVAQQYAIASRLSFMFWGAPPDAELRRLAAAVKLRDPATLDAQVDRLLADPRSEDFVRPFVTQWLALGQPITIAMSSLQNQDFRFGRHLKASMQDETIAYFRQALADNRPLRELLSSNWTMMNDALARHYGYPPLDGATLRKVQLRADDPRGGGILGQAGIQSMLCWMGDNWVIYRGAWALRHILDDPPPAPPLEVHELAASDSKNHGKSFRELLQQHQADSKCTICHTKMDPLGFAFQNFDLSGRWREREYDHYITKEIDGKIEWNGAGKDRPVDATGHLPRGETFTNFTECRELMAKNYQQDMARGLMKNFVLYATGRLPGIVDMTEIRSILASQKAAGYPLRDLLKQVVRSDAFLNH